VIESFYRLAERALEAIERGVTAIERIADKLHEQVEEVPAPTISPVFSPVYSYAPLARSEEDVASMKACAAIGQRYRMYDGSIDEIVGRDIDGTWLVNEVEGPVGNSVRREFADDAPARWHGYKEGPL
jgi:hypothetical protein